MADTPREAAPPQASGWAGRAGKLVEIGLVVAATAAVAEVVIRVVNPTPRVQITRSKRPGVHGWDFTMVGDQPTWRDAGSDARRNEACPRDGTVDVVLMGTSITFGTGLGPDEPFPHLLQRSLDAGAPGRWCVLNLAQPAYVGSNKLAELPGALARFRPKMVLWEVWGNDPDRYTMVGPDAFAFKDLRVGADGLPWVLPVPNPLHAWLFEHARLYQYGTLALDGRVDDGADRWSQWADARMEQVYAQVTASGAKLALYAPTPLYKAPDELADHPDQAMSTARAWGAKHDVPVFLFAEALRGSDPAEIALHRDGHLNALGHARIAPVFEAWMVSLLPDVAPTAP
jgi:hypothetical protein